MYVQYVLQTRVKSSGLCLWKTSLPQRDNANWAEGAKTEHSTSSCPAPEGTSVLSDPAPLQPTGREGDMHCATNTHCTYIHTYIPPVNHTLDEPSRSSSELPRMFKVVRVLESCPGTVIKRLYPRCSCSMVERCYNQTEAHTEYSLPQQSALLSYIIWYRSPLSMYVRMQHSTQHSTLLHLNTISLNHCSVLQ